MGPNVIGGFSPVGEARVKAGLPDVIPTYAKPQVVVLWHAADVLCFHARNLTVLLRSCEYARGTGQ
jgi:hypothetical protein